MKRVIDGTFIIQEYSALMLISLAHLVWKPSVLVAVSVVCLSRVRSRKLREIRAKISSTL